MGSSSDHGTADVAAVAVANAAGRLYAFGPAFEPGLASEREPGPAPGPEPGPGLAPVLARGLVLVHGPEHAFAPGSKFASAPGHGDPNETAAGGYFGPTIQCFV